jgi:hypothetical protein
MIAAAKYNREVCVGNQRSSGITTAGRFLFGAGEPSEEMQSYGLTFLPG